jgi:hypothetical protein
VETGGLIAKFARPPGLFAHFRPGRVTSIRARLLSGALAATLLSAGLPALARAQNDYFPCPSGPGQIACENSLPGDPQSDWQTSGNGDPSIQGFATQMSVNVGQTISFKIDTPSSAYHIDILRIGYYGGDGARKIVSGLRPSASLPQSQPPCLTDPGTGLVDCGNWAVSASWTVPSDAVSGLYIAHLVRDDIPGGIDSVIPFVVRNDASHSAIVYQTSDETWEAYNTYGGNSLYSCSLICPPGNPEGYQGAFAVSYNRPLDPPVGQATPWYAEFPMIYFLEENGYDVSYLAGADTDRSGSLILNHRVFMTAGHDEYWSAQQRANVQAAVNAGVNLAFFTGNEMFWKTRWQNSIDGSNTPYRTLVSYKETHFNAPVDPLDPPIWTGAWADPRFSPPADGGQPANSLTGQEWLVNSGTAALQVPSTYSALRFWRNTAVASLQPGQTATLAPATLGYEWDVDADNGFRPAGEFDLSSTTVTGTENIADYGTAVSENNTTTHHLTLYRAASGALVFGAGTVQWSWGLDAQNPNGQPPDASMQQATVNLLADMGVSPQTLMAGLTPASASTDTTPPTSSISAPSPGTKIGDGSKVIVAGSASDSGGGVVAGVEVSTDGGAKWHPATITGPDSQTVNWTYTWIAHGAPSTTIESRAVDDSGNLETPSDGESVTIGCPCSLWGDNITPAVPDSGDGSSIELGMKFTSGTFGQVNGIRFYKSALNTGTHVGALWSASGQLLASATFTGETSSGWQSVSFSSPVTIMPNTTYIAAYLAPHGHYATTPGYFYPAPAPTPVGGAIVDSPPLHALGNNASGGNGVFAYTSTLTFPANSYLAANYWVDVSFMPSPPPGQVTNVSATAGKGSATVTWSAPTGGGPVTSYVVTPYIGATAQPATTVSGMPPSTGVTITGLSPGSSYTFTVQATNPNGAGPASSNSTAVVPLALTAPSPPTGVTATPADREAQVSWTTPSDNGGSPITGYTITPYANDVAQTPLQAGPNATAATVTGLTNGTAYVFTVTATNAIGATTSASTPPATPGETLFALSRPAIVDGGDGSAVNLGLKFTPTVAGDITGVRFYKALANVGTHVGSLWTSAGQLLASVTFTNESPSGWQTAMFSQPVAVQPATTYIVSYVAPDGHYSFTASAFDSPLTNGDLSAPGNSTTANGVFAYSGVNAFPNSTYQAANYWVDVLFVPYAAPGAVTNVTATAGLAAATVSWTAPSSGGPVQSYVVTPYIGTSAQTPTTVTGSPPNTTVTVTGLQADTQYTFTVHAANLNGNGPESAASPPVTPLPPTAPDAPAAVTATPASGEALVSWSRPDSDGGSPITAYTVTPYVSGLAQAPVQVGPDQLSTTVTGLTNGTSYAFTVTATNAIGSTASGPSAAITPADTLFDFATPATVDSGDGAPNNLGISFSSSVAGEITGIRFYKAQANTGTHIGYLWSAGGQLLASAPFTNETAAGWQTVLFSQPVQIAANTTYVASYYTPTGHYSFTGSAFTNAITNGPLTALANAAAPYGNGTYAYAGPNTFPNNSYQAANYYVDVLFQPSG